MKKKLCIIGLLWIVILGCSACTNEVIKIEKEPVIEAQEVEQSSIETPLEVAGAEESRTEAEAEVAPEQEAVAYPIEGEMQTETITWVNGTYQYSIPYDEASFTFDSVEGIDSIVSDAVTEDGMNMASLVIVQNAGITAESFVEDLMGQAGESASRDETTIGQDAVPVAHVNYEEGSQYVDMYVLPKGEDCLLIEIRTEKEAYEGLGASLRYYLSLLKFEG